MRILIAGAVSVLLAACATDGGSGDASGDLPLRSFFRCTNGGSFTVQYFGQDRAVVTTSGGNRFDLNRQENASGYSYGDGTVTFSTDLTTGVLTGTPYAYDGCQQADT